MPGPLRVTHVLAPARSGGLETVVHLLAAAQARRGDEVRVVLLLSESTEEPPLLMALRREGIPVDPIVLPARAYFQEHREVDRLLARHRTQVLHTHGYRPDVLHSGAARRSGIATVTTVHGFTGGNARNRFYEWLQMRAFRRFDAVVVVSRSLYEALRRRGVPRDRLHTIPNAFEPLRDLEPAEVARAALGLRTAMPGIGWVGRVSREKGPDIFLEALTRIRTREWQAVVVGDGPERSTLAHAAESRGLGPHRLRWAGDLPAAARLFRAFDLLVLSSRTEGTPMVVLEAMSAAVPIVATGVGGVPDLLAIDEGWIVSPERPDQLASAIDQALSDPGERAARAARALIRLRSERGVSPWADRYADIYHSLIRR